METPKLILEEEYSLLDHKEREFCKTQNISCKDFYVIK